ncbi:MAG: hypothetical protein HP491_03770 [Nitrospira sp.]|nr:hypothetical protein [Nitrospira sp.]MBH0180951.1 hypothetical protein [Nitrospira sp.]MBH0185567.1 hypothetical protein [Nitrospira sp.]
MLKFIAVLLVIAGAFAAGYYAGQQPVGILQTTVSDLTHRLAISEETIKDARQSLKNLSQNAMETTAGIERDLRRRKALMEAKSQVVQAKAYVLDRNYSDGAKELTAAASTLEAAAKGTKSDASTQAMLDAARALRDTRVEVAMGKLVPLKKFDDLQRRIDQSLDK